MSHWVLIGGGNGSSNLGDEAMWLAAANVFRAVFPSKEIVTDGASGWRAPIPGVTVLPFMSMALRRGGKLPRWVTGGWSMGADVERLISRPGRDAYARHAAAKQANRPTGELAVAWHDQLQDAEGVIFCGSGGINDHYASHAITAWGLLVNWARSMNIPIAFIGQGIGPIRNSDNWRAAASMLSKAEIVTVRDRESLENVQGMHLGVPIVRTADWACLLSPNVAQRVAARDYHAALLQDAPFVAVSMHVRPSSTKSDTRAMALLLRNISEYCLDEGERVLFVPTMRGHRGADDIATVRSLLPGMPERVRQNIFLMDRALDIGFVRALLGRAKGIVSTRYHALVFALSEGIPAIGVSHDEYYTQKLCGAFESLGDTARVVPLRGASDLIEDLLIEMRVNSPRLIDESVLAEVREPLVSFLNAHR